MPLYGQSDGSLLKGTVTVTNADETISGSGTAFTSELTEGSSIYIDDHIYEVGRIDSDTALELTKKYYISGETSGGFALEDGTLDDPDTATSVTESLQAFGVLLLDGYLESGDHHGEGEKFLNETQTSTAGIRAIVRELPKHMTPAQRDKLVGVDIEEQSRSGDQLMHIAFGANTNSGGFGGSGYTGAPTITVAAPETFTFDPTSDTDGDGELTVENASYGGRIGYTAHGFEMGTAVVYNDGGGTVMTGVTEGNVYFIYPRDEDSFRLGTEYGEFELGFSNGVASTIMLEDGTVGNCEGTEDAHIGAALIQEYGGPVDTTSETTIADTGFVNITAAGAGTAHTFIGVTSTAAPTFIQTGIRLESGATDDDSGEFLLLDGIDSNGGVDESAGNAFNGGRLLMGGGSALMDSDVSASDINPDFVIGHLAGAEMTLSGTGYTSPPTITVSAPAALTFNASSAVDGANITITNHGLVPDDAVTYSRNSGTAISELTDGGTFFVVSVDGDDIQLSATQGGSAITLTDGSSENHTLTGETASATAVLGPGSTRGSGVAHTGWAIKTVGTGGRAGRVHYETLVAGNIQGDFGALRDAV